MEKSTLFIDESGISNLSDQVNQPFSLTGIIMAESELNSTEGIRSFFKIEKDEVYKYLKT